MIKCYWGELRKNDMDLHYLRRDMLMDEKTTIY